MMPILLYIAVGTVRELSPLSKGEAEMAPPVMSALKALTTLCSAKSFNKDDDLKYTEDNLEVSYW